MPPALPVPAPFYICLRLWNCWLPENERHEEERADEPPTGHGVAEHHERGRVRGAPGGRSAADRGGSRLRDRLRVADAAAPAGGPASGEHVRDRPAERAVYSRADGDRRGAVACSEVLVPASRRGGIPLPGRPQREAGGIGSPADGRGVLSGVGDREPAGGIPGPVPGQRAGPGPRPAGIRLLRAGDAGAGGPQVPVLGTGAGVPRNGCAHPVARLRVLHPETGEGPGRRHLSRPAQAAAQATARR
jgi:hypothetical protein